MCECEADDRSSAIGTVGCHLEVGPCLNICLSHKAPLELTFANQANAQFLCATRERGKSGVQDNNRKSASQHQGDLHYKRQTDSHPRTACEIMLPLIYTVDTLTKRMLSGARVSSNVLFGGSACHADVALATDST